VETRILLVREDGSTIGASYLWDHDSQQAWLQRSRRQIPFPQDAAGVAYQIPGPDDCLICHHRERPVLGFNLEQLNRNLPGQGSSQSQLLHLSELHCFTSDDFGDDPSRRPLAAMNDSAASLEHRARSYLHANCGFCHSPQGPEHVKLDLRMDANFPRDIIGASAQLGYHLIDGQRARQLITPGIPEASAIWLRLQTSDRRVSMPYLGRTRPDQAAVECIAEWIRSLAPPQVTTRADMRHFCEIFQP
jgi:hypothetical protein